MIEYMESTPYTSPWAPWNQEQQSNHETECPYCCGRGFFFGAENIVTGEQKSCKEITYNMLPDTMDEAESKGQKWIKWKDECPECCGTGTVEEEVLPSEYYMERAYGI